MKLIPLGILAPSCIALAFSTAVALATTPKPAPILQHDAVGNTWQVDLQGQRAPMLRPALAPLPAPHGSPTAAWSALGPPGADVSVVAASPANPDLVLAGVAPNGSWGGSLYRSVDDGAHWAQVTALAGKSVFDIAFSASGQVFLAMQDGMRRSDDGGASWTDVALNLGLNSQVNTVAVDPGDPSRLWAGIASALGSQTINVMRSIDNGLTWQDKTPPLAAPMTCTGVAIDPDDSDIVIAVFSGDFGGSAVWVTTDGGATWTDRSAGLPSNPLNAVVYDGTRLLVGGGQLFGSEYVGLYSSSDLGMTWAPLHDSSWPLLVVTDIAVDPTDPQTILASTAGAGVNRTTDGGATWETGVGGTGALAAQSVSFNPGRAAEAFLGATSLGVFRSSDAGANFAASGDGISELNLFSIAASPLDPDAIAVAFQGQNSGGVFSSTDGGAHWALESLPPTRYSAVGYAPDGVLYAISSGPTSIAEEGLYRRNADGSWSALGPDQGPFFESDLAALRFDDGDPDLILLGGSDFGVAGSAGTIWRSADAGGTWAKVYLGPDNHFVTDFATVAAGADQTIAASYDERGDPNQGGVLRSVDAGVDWTPALSGLPSYLRQPKLCASSGEPQTLFLSILSSTGKGLVFSSPDAALGWTQTAWAGGSVIADIACDVQDESVLYIAQYGSPLVARSEDQGDTFAPFDSGLEAAGSPAALAMAHASNGPTRLLLASGHGSFATETAPAGDTIFANGFEMPMP